MQSRSQTIESAVDRTPAAGRDDTLYVYLNHGWEAWQGSGEPDPAWHEAAATGNWRPADLDRIAADDRPVCWFRRDFFLPVVTLPVYHGIWQPVGGTLRVFLNGREVSDPDTLGDLARPGCGNRLWFRLEGTGAFISRPVALAIRRRIGAAGSLGGVSRRFTALPPPPPAELPVRIGPRLIRMRQGVLRIPIRRAVRAVHVLGAINPEIAGTCNSVFGLRFGPGDEDRLFLHQGEHIGTPDGPRDLPSADCFMVQANLAGCEIDSRIGLYDTVLDNPRPDRPVSELVIDKYLHSQSATQIVVAITLETERGFEPLPLGSYANAPNDLPLPRGGFRLAFAPRRPRPLLADGVPYLTADDGKLVRFRGGRAELPGGFTGRRLYLLGAVTGQISPYGSVNRRVNAFFGDELGNIRVCYEDGVAEDFPLVFGVNVWIGREWSSAVDIHGVGQPSARFTGPFHTDDAAGRTLEAARAWRIVDGRAHRWGQIAIVLRPRRVRVLVFTRNPAFDVEPVFSAITVEGAGDAALLPLPAGVARDGVPRFAPPALRPRDLRGRRLEARVRPLQLGLYRCEATLPAHPAYSRPADYEGPAVRFEGEGRWATMLSNVFAHGLRDTVAKRVPGPDTSATSTPRAPLYGIMGVWKTGVGRGHHAGYDCFWSRDHGRTALERYEMGLAHRSPNEIGSTDRAARETAWPPHHTQEPDRSRPVSAWYRCTLDGHPVFGNPENDGHGLVMLQRHAHWLHAGMTRQWLATHWQGTEESAEWIAWQLDHPFHPAPTAGRRSGPWNRRLLGRVQPPDVLWTSSECSGYRDYEIYANAGCLAGLRAAIRMARAAGRTKVARRWAGYAARLSQGIERSLVRSSPFGPVWRYSEHSSWDAWCEAAGPLLFAPDLDAYDAARALSPRWLHISANTFDFLLDRLPDRMAPGHYGYGFGFFVQAALLLDRMTDASRIFENILRLNYDSRLDPWIVTESIVLRHDRSFWHRLGDHGNSVQQGEILKGIRLALGVDDLDPDRLRLMPRLPDFCDRLEVKAYPVMMRRGGLVREMRADLSVERRGAGWWLRVDFDAPLTAAAVRLGPFAPGTRGALRLNGQSAPGRWIEAGDRTWVWLDDIGDGRRSRWEIEAG